VTESEFETVYLARHGQTEWNLAGRRQGQLDSPLTADGLDQARRVAGVMAYRRVDGVFTSPLGRAMVTAELCSHDLGVPLIVVNDLAEVDHGLMAGLTNAEIDQAFPGQLELRSANKYSWRFPEGESYSDVDRRAGEALRQIALHDASRPLIVSHEMIGRMLLRNLLDLDPEEALRWIHPHNIVRHIDMTTGTLSTLG